MKSTRSPSSSDPRSAPSIQSQRMSGSSVMGWVAGDRRGRSGGARPPLLSPPYGSARHAPDAVACGLLRQARDQRRSRRRPTCRRARVRTSVGQHGPDRRPRASWLLPASGCTPQSRRARCLPPRRVEDRERYALTESEARSEGVLPDPVCSRDDDGQNRDAQRARQADRARPEADLDPEHRALRKDGDALPACHRRRGIAHQPACRERGVVRRDQLPGRRR